MRKIKFNLFILLTLAFLASCQSTRRGESQPFRGDRTDTKPLTLNFPQLDEKRFEELLSNWEKIPRDQAIALSKKYGMPNEGSENFFVWYNNGPWRRTLVSRYGATHLMPQKHVDIVQQTVFMQVPPNKLDELAQFNGSILVERSRGEISARCENEDMNLLVLNMAKEIIEGRLTPQKARENYARIASTVMPDELESRGNQTPTALFWSSGDPDTNLIE